MGTTQGCKYSVKMAPQIVKRNGEEHSGAMQYHAGSAKVSGRVSRSLAAALGPGLATGIVLTADLTGVGAASLYMLAVVGASAFGGLWSGLGAAVLSFLGLNFFFTPPRHTFSVQKIEDLIALFVFFAVAGIVGGLFARILAERVRVERREQESVMLNRFTTALLSTQPIRRVLIDFAQMAVDRFGLARCAIDLDGMEPVEVAAPERPEGIALVIPVEAAEVRFGTLTATPAPEVSFEETDRRLLVAFAGQVGVAMERSRLDTEAREARTDAEISQIRAALFSSVTHDLRTPLSSIKAGVTSLMDRDARPDETQRAELLQTMLEETDRLNHLVGNILNLARARAGGLALEKELTPFEDVIEAVLARIRKQLAAFAVRAMIAPGLPAIWVDPIQMDQALSNILENALRYAPAGGDIMISVKPWQGGVQVRVADRGPGIPTDEREQVFEPFFRGRTDRSRGGTGLGLAITRAVVAAHQGLVRIDGTPGGGTTVVIELPAGRPPDEGLE